MFRIRCLTSGSFIKLNASCALYVLGANVSLIPKNIKDNINLVPLISLVNDKILTGANFNFEYLEFFSQEAADWFIRRRLTYNPKRKDTDKLKFMSVLFETNDLPEITVKVEFDVVEF